MRKLIRIIVEAEALTPFTTKPTDPNYEKKVIQNAEILRDEIKRHCDNYESVSLRREYACEFCGDEEDYGKEEPACCRKAVDEFTAKDD
jgi:hypothetical protein